MGRRGIEETVINAQRGSEAALADLYRWFMEDRRFFACVYRILRDWEEDVRDIMQECAVNICHNIGKFDPDKGDIASWCHRIAANAATDQFRKRHRERTIPLRIVPSMDSDLEGEKEVEILSDAPKPDKVILSREISEIIDEAEKNAGLSTRQKLIWRLHRAGYDISFAAMTAMGDVNDRTRAAVSRDIYRAMRKIELYLWTNYPDWSELYRNIVFLFGVGLELQIHLDKGNIAEELQTEFRDRELVPPRKVIIPNKKKGILWLITAKDSPIYLVRKEKRRLDIYR